MIVVVVVFVISLLYLPKAREEIFPLVAVHGHGCLTLPQLCWPVLIVVLAHFGVGEGFRSCRLQNGPRIAIGCGNKIVHLRL